MAAYPARRAPAPLLARACVGLATLACCAALGSCASPQGEAKPKYWAVPLAAGEWHVHLPLRSAACARGLSGGNGPVDTATFELTPAGELKAHSVRGSVAAFGGCSLAAPGLFDTDALTLFSRPEPAGVDDVQSNVHVRYGSATLYGGALVTTVDHCLSCKLREDTPQTQLEQQGCRRFTYGGENMQTFCEDLAKSAAARPLNVASTADMFSAVSYAHQLYIHQWTRHVLHDSPTRGNAGVF